MAQKKQQSLYRNVLDLMQKKAAGINSSHLAERELMQLGELLVTASDISATDRIEIVRQVNEMAEKLSATGDERNAKAYLVALANEIAVEVEPVENRLGRTA